MRSDVPREGTVQKLRRLGLIGAVLAAGPALGIAAAVFKVPDREQEAEIERALEAAPARIAAGATVVDSTGHVLRSGSNGWTCMPTSGPGSTHPACNDAIWLRLFDALAHGSDFEADRLGISYMLAGDDDVRNADPFATHADPGEVWAQEGPHLMLVVPDPSMLAGISDDPHNGGPYVVGKGTPYVHVVVPLGKGEGERPR